MAKFKLLYERSNIYFTIKNFEDYTPKFDDRLKRDIDSFRDYYYEKGDEDLRKKTFQYIVDIVNEILTVVYQRIKFYKFIYFDEKTTIQNILSSIISYDVETADGVYPVSIYVSGKKEDKMTIGLLLYKNGKLEYFEGNEEASTETIKMVNKALNPKPKLIQIYASHGIKVIEKIKKTKKLPDRLYVSPDKNHAAGYWDLKEERYLFTGMVDIRDINQESHMDWKTIGEVSIKNFKLI